MGIDGVNTKIPVYKPVRPRARAKLNIGGVLPAEELPKPTDEESREDRRRPTQGEDDDRQGRIDEHI